MVLSFLLVIVWSLYYLSENQDVQERVYQEIMEQIGSETDLDYKNIKELK